MNNNDNNNESSEVKDLVIARLDTLPENIRISVGSEGDFTKSQLIERVRSGDTIGRKIVESQMQFLQSLKEGAIYEQMYSSDAPQS